MIPTRARPRAPRGGGRISGLSRSVAFTAQFNTPQGPWVAHVGAQNLYVGGDFTKVNYAPPGFVEFPADAGN